MVAENNRKGMPENLSVDSTGQPARLFIQHLFYSGTVLNVRDAEKEQILWREERGK